MFLNEVFFGVLRSFWEHCRGVILHEKKPWRIVGSSALRLQLKSQNRTKAIGRSKTQTIYKLQPFKVPSEWVGDSHLACTVWSFESGLAIKLESTSGNSSACLAWVGMPHIHTVVGAAHSKETSINGSQAWKSFSTGSLPPFKTGFEQDDQLYNLCTKRPKQPFSEALASSSLTFLFALAVDGEKCWRWGTCLEQIAAFQSSLTALGYYFLNSFVTLNFSVPAQNLP